MVFYIFIQILLDDSVRNSGDPDQTPGLHGLPMTHKKDARLTLFILHTDEQVLWQTVKAQIKCCIMQHFSRVCTVCLDIKIFKDRTTSFLATP